MMRDRLYIDGVDVYTNYGIYITKDGLNDLIAFPPLKAVTTNDWHEEDGIEADLDDPVLDTHDVTINFAVAGLNEGYVELMVSDLLSDYAYHEFYVANIGRTYKLRLVSQPKYDYGKTLGIFTLKFADDFPLANYAYVAPYSTIVGDSDDFSLDDVNLTTYGVRVLSGTYSSIIALSDVKQNLLRNIPTVSGAIYGNEGVTFKSKDVKIQCLMRAATLEELWRNWDALLYNLTLPNERTFAVKEFFQEFSCYYNSCSVSEFNHEGNIWLKFTLTLTLTQGFRDMIAGVALATEDNIPIMLEDSAETLIDMKGYNK